VPNQIKLRLTLVVDLMQIEVQDLVKGKTDLQLLQKLSQQKKKLKKIKLEKLYKLQGKRW
jgi:hypothetical protein